MWSAPGDAPSEHASTACRRGGARAEGTRGGAAGADAGCDRTRGRGLERLRSAGIETECAGQEPSVRALAGYTRSNSGWTTLTNTLAYQLDLLKAVGFSAVEVLHKHGCFAAFGGVRVSHLE